MATFEIDAPPSTVSGDSVREIQDLMEEWQEALASKDLDRLLQYYDAEVRFFDAVPPHQQRGAEAYRHAWEQMMPFLPQALGSDIRELEIRAGGNVAFASCLQRLTNRATHEAATCGWVRVTLGFQRKEGAWKVVHEHVSVPFNPQSAQAAFATEA
jgi:uncharacterized protein (TIGR02246 family)